MIHKFTLFGTNIVVDVSSGAVHVFDEVASQVMDLYESHMPDEIAALLLDKYSETQVEEALEEIRRLKADGLLFSEDIYEQYIPLWNKKPVLKAMCLHIAHDCNLRCRYCFASTGDFGVGRSLMSPEIGKKAIDLLISESAGRRNLEVDMFGGEPLMNFNTVKEIVEYASQRGEETGKNFRFTITTNGLLLDEEKKNYINKHFGNVVLSIDGREEINDRMRIRVDGSGTYKHILPKFKNIAESRDQSNYYVRGTFTRENTDFASDVIHLADQGFRQISVEPVVAACDSGFDIREEELPLIMAEYEKLAMEYEKRREAGNGFNFFHFMLDLDQGPCVAKRLKGCGSGYEYVAVTPEGDIYPCHQFVGMEEFKMGNVNVGELNGEIREHFGRSNIYTKKECRECWARFFCSGGCAANAFQFNKDINTPYRIGCEMEKKRVECALWIKTQVSAQND